MSFPVTVTTTLGLVVSVIFVLVSSPYWAPFVNLAYSVLLCFRPVTVPLVPPSRFVQFPLFILYWIVYPLAVVLNVTLAAPPLQLGAPISISPSIFFSVTAFDIVSVLFPALSTVSTCR